MREEKPWGIYSHCGKQIIDVDASVWGYFVNGRIFNRPSRGGMWAMLWMQSSLWSVTRLIRSSALEQMLSMSFRNDGKRVRIPFFRPLLNFFWCFFVIVVICLNSYIKATISSFSYILTQSVQFQFDSFTSITVFGIVHDLPPALMNVYDSLEYF